MYKKMLVNINEIKIQNSIKPKGVKKIDIYYFCLLYFNRSAFFEGVIEKPCHKVKKAILGCQQTEVLVAINTDGVTVTDKEKPVSKIVSEENQNIFVSTRRPNA